MNMKDEEKDPLWELLGKARHLDPLPRFTDDVLARVERLDQSPETLSWFRLPRLFWGTTLAGAAACLVFVGILMMPGGPSGQPASVAHSVAHSAAHSRLQPQPPLATASVVTASASVPAVTPNAQPVNFSFNEGEKGNLVVARTNAPVMADVSNPWLALTNDSTASSGKVYNLNAAPVGFEVGP
ncbi:MAG: hypothetical protein SFY92_11435 [Verrucomicrobiae bacterium]|nr:hypothetical protein [Verrucomicrobiae bacterium]